jgi:hypothetical protein
MNGAARPRGGLLPLPNQLRGTIRRREAIYTCKLRVPVVADPRVCIHEVRCEHVVLRRLPAAPPRQVEYRSKQERRGFPEPRHRPAPHWTVYFTVPPARSTAFAPDAMGVMLQLHVVVGTTGRRENRLCCYTPFARSPTGNRSTRSSLCRRPRRTARAQSGCRCSPEQ